MGKSIILQLLSKIDSKWIPAIIGGLGLLITVIYLIYTKKKLEQERKELRVKLAVAHSKALERNIHASQEASAQLAKEANDLTQDINKSKHKIEALKASSLNAKTRLLKATTWEDLNL